MAARKNKGVGTGTMSDSWRDKIREGVLADRLMRCAIGELDMTAIQVKAADILLKKVAPDVARTEVTGKDGGAIEHKDVSKSDAEILAQYMKK